MSALTINIADFAKDIRLNLSSIFNENEQDGLSAKQIALIGLASAYTTKSTEVINALVSYAQSLSVDEKELEAAKSSATIMGMNNIYYRFIHLVEDKAYMKMPARLRMNVMANPGVDKVDFELMSMAVSAINGCGLCMDSHGKSLAKLNIEPLAIQTTVRIAAVINAAAQAVSIVG